MMRVLLLCLLIAFAAAQQAGPSGSVTLTRTSLYESELVVSLVAPVETTGACHILIRIINPYLQLNSDVGVNVGVDISIPVYDVPPIQNFILGDEGSNASYAFWDGSTLSGETSLSYVARYRLSNISVATEFHLEIWTINAAEYASCDPVTDLVCRDAWEPGICRFSPLSGDWVFLETGGGFGAEYYLPPTICGDDIVDPAGEVCDGSVGCRSDCLYENFTSSIISGETAGAGSLVGYINIPSYGLYVLTAVGSGGGGADLSGADLVTCNTGDVAAGSGGSGAAGIYQYALYLNQGDFCTITITHPGSPMTSQGQDGGITSFSCNGTELIRAEGGKGGLSASSSLTNDLTVNNGQAGGSITNPVNAIATETSGFTDGAACVVNGTAASGSQAAYGLCQAADMGDNRAGSFNGTTVPLPDIEGFRRRQGVPAGGNSLLGNGAYKLDALPTTIPARNGGGGIGGTAGIPATAGGKSFFLISAALSNVTEPLAICGNELAIDDLEFGEQCAPYFEPLGECDPITCQFIVDQPTITCSPDSFVTQVGVGVDFNCTAEPGVGSPGVAVVCAIITDPTGNASITETSANSTWNVITSLGDRTQVIVVQCTATDTSGNMTSETISVLLEDPSLAMTVIPAVGLPLTFTNTAVTSTWDTTVRNVGARLELISISYGGAGDVVSIELVTNSSVCPSSALIGVEIPFLNYDQACTYRFVIDTDLVDTDGLSITAIYESNYLDPLANSYNTSAQATQLFNVAAVVPTSSDSNALAITAIAISAFVLLFAAGGIIVVVLIVVTKTAGKPPVFTASQATSVVGNNNLRKRASMV